MLCSSCQRTPCSYLPHPCSLLLHTATTTTLLLLLLTAELFHALLPGWATTLLSILLPLLCLLLLLSSTLLAVPLLHLLLQPWPLNRPLPPLLHLLLLTCLCLALALAYRGQHWLLWLLALLLGDGVLVWGLGAWPGGVRGEGQGGQQ